MILIESSVVGDLLTLPGRSYEYTKDSPAGLIQDLIHTTFTRGDSGLTRGDISNPSVGDDPMDRRLFRGYLSL